MFLDNGGSEDYSRSYIYHLFQGHKCKVTSSKKTLITLLKI